MLRLTAKLIVLVRARHQKANMQSTADTALGYMKAWGNKAKQYALNLTDIEIKVEQATNNDPWGPHGTVMGGES